MVFLLLFAGIKLTISGHSKTSWLESKTNCDGGKHKTTEIFFEALEKYLEAKTDFNLEISGKQN